MTAETCCRYPRKQFPSVAQQTSVIFMSHIHAQVKAFPALQIGMSPSVTGLQLHPHPLAFLWPESSRIQCLHKWPPLLLWPSHIIPPPPALLPQSFECHCKAEARYLSPPSLVPSFPPLLLAFSPEYLLCLATVVSSMMLGVEKTHNKIAKTSLVGIDTGLHLFFFFFFQIGH